jgi:hypothetical protein
LAYSPWIQGSANWREQFWLALGTIAVLLLFCFDLLDRYIRRTSFETLRVPAASLLFLAIAAFAYIQSLALFPIASSSTSSPNSIQIQRWFLGQPNTELAEKFAISESESTPISNKAEFESRRLALSIEPLHSRAAVPSLAMVAAMIWLGAVAFQQVRWQMSLMIVVTILGLTVGILGMLDILAWNRREIQILPGGQTFGVFVSRNCAGGYLAIAFAASMGLSTWVFGRPNQREHQYAYAGESPAVQIMRIFEDRLSQVTTEQIACLLGNAMLFAFIVATASRGAIISALATGFTVLAIGSFSHRNQGRWIVATIVIVLCLSFAIFFSLDNVVSERFEQITNDNFLEEEKRGGRLYIWSMAIKAFSWFWLTGSGLGTFHFAHLPFQNPQNAAWAYHAESLYLQALVELGVVGGGLILGTAFLAYRALAQVGARLPSSRNKAKEIRLTFEPIYTVGLALGAGQFLHAFVDFTLILPALYLPAAVLFGAVIGAGWERRRLDSESENVDELLSVRETSTERFRMPLKESDQGFSKSVVEGHEMPSSRRSSKATSQFKQYPPYTSALLGFSTLVVMILLLAAGLASIDAMRLVKKMEKWSNEHGRDSFQIASLSAYLAGIWESSYMPTRRIPIVQVPDGLRMIGEGLLSEYRLARRDALAEEDRLGRDRIEAMSSPIALRIEMLEKKRTLSESESPREFDEVEVSVLLDDEKQWLRWMKAKELFEMAHRGSPLDWRLVWLRMLTDPKIDLSSSSNWIEKCRLLAQFDPSRLLNLGLLVREGNGERVKSEKIWKDMLKVRRDMAPVVAKIMAADTPDGEIDIDIFPQDPGLLQYLIGEPMFTSARFPKTHEQIWQRVDELSQALEPKNPDRARWLATAARHFGRTEEELEHLELAVRQNPSNRWLRLEWINRLAATGDLEHALQEAEFVLAQIPGDPQADAVVKGLRERIRESNKSTPPK